MPFFLNFCPRHRVTETIPLVFPPNISVFSFLSFHSFPLSFLSPSFSSFFLENSLSSRQADLRPVLSEEWLGRQISEFSLVYREYQHSQGDTENPIPPKNPKPKPNKEKKNSLCIMYNTHCV